MTLRDVCNFVRQHSGQLALGIAREQQAGIDADISPGQSEGIDCRVVYDEELEVLLTVARLSRKSSADTLDRKSVG